MDFSQKTPRHLGLQCIPRKVQAHGNCPTLIKEKYSKDITTESQIGLHLP